MDSIIKSMGIEPKSFFGTDGLTSTSANHYANLAKETGRKIQNYLSNVRFYSTGISIIGDTTSGTIREGLSDDCADDIKSGLSLLAKTNSLIAFFREAIKERDDLLNKVRNWTDEKARIDYNTHYNEVQLRRPVRAQYLTEEDVIASWSVGEQEKYLSLEAEASVYGKFIHEDGALSSARTELMKVISNPMSVKENGRDTVIYKYTPTTSQETVDALFFDLQARYREVQAELNGMKKKIQDTVSEQNLVFDQEYSHALEEWHSETRACDAELREIMEKENIIRSKAMQEVQSLKIVVPNRLKDVFESLKNL